MKGLVYLIPIAIAEDGFDAIPSYINEKIGERSLFTFIFLLSSVCFLRIRLSLLGIILSLLGIRFIFLNYVWDADQTRSPVM